MWHYSYSYMENQMSYALEYDITDNKLNTKIYEMKSTNLKYKVVKYDEKYVCDNDEQLGQYRSVIFTEPEGKLVSYTLPKSITMDLFTSRMIDQTIQDDIYVSEIVEGTMLTLFWDDRINGWELASKGAVGGNYWFYRTQYSGKDEPKNQKTFRTMFLEAFHAEKNQDINDIAYIQELPKGVCYNFVLQHPDNHIVLSVEHPHVFLVSVYELDATTNTARFIHPRVYQNWPVFQSIHGIIEFPKEPVIKFASVEEYRQSFCIPQLPGLMFLNVSGERTVLENPAYAEIKTLRGNNPNLHYQYLCLLRIGKVLDFLGYFPQYKKVFRAFYTQWESFVTNVHQSYVSYYVKHENVPISKRYFPLIHKLHHEVYIPSIATGKIIMRRSEVRKRLLEIPPSEIFYYLYKEE